MFQSAVVFSGRAVLWLSACTLHILALGHHPRADIVRRRNFSGTPEGFAYVIRMSIELIRSCVTPVPEIDDDPT